MKIHVSKSCVTFEMGAFRIKVPFEDGVIVKGSRIVAIKLPSTGAVVPVHLLLENGVKIQIDPKVPYHL